MYSPSRSSAVHLRTKCRHTSIRAGSMVVDAMRAPLTLLSQPLSTNLAMDGVLARGRDARKVRRRTNSHTPPRPRHCAALGPGPQDPCPALKSGAACAISPGNPSLCRSSQDRWPYAHLSHAQGVHRGQAARGLVEMAAWQRQKERDDHTLMQLDANLARKLR